MQNRRPRSRPRKGAAQGHATPTRTSATGPRSEGRRIPSDSKLGRRIISPRPPLPAEGSEEPQAHTVPSSRASGSSVALTKQAIDSSGAQMETHTTASRKSVRSVGKESAEAGLLVRSAPSESKGSPKTIATSTDHEPTARLTAKFDDEERKRTGFAAMSSSSAVMRRSERRVPTPRGGTPERVGPVASQEQVAPTYRGATGTRLVTIGVSMLVVVVITVLAMIFMWPGPKTPESKSSSASVMPGGSSAAPSDSACAPREQLSVWISGAEIKGAKGRPVRRGSGKKTVRHFFGIPYGTSTSGGRRFNYSEPFDMPGSFSADRHGPQCFQPSPKSTHNMSEECLTLSIWTPFICQPEEALKTVVVVVSSDWFQSGHVSDYEDACEEIASLDAVVVAINFRLGVFGFLRTPSDNMPTNVGFRDIIAALEWLRASIAAFYGDRNGMVALGLGSGGVLLSLDLLSPLFGMKGFFRRLILHGMVAGSLLPRSSVEHMRTLGSSLSGCASFTLDLAAMLMCLRNASAPALLAASQKMKVLRFVPSLDENVTSGPPSQAAVSPWSMLLVRPLKGVSVLCGYSKEDSRKLFDDVVVPSEGIVSGADPKTTVGELTHFFTMRRAPEIYDELPEEAKEALSRPGYGGFHDFLSDALYYCPLMDMASAATAKKGEVFVYANSGSEAFAPMMNYSAITIFAKTGEAPWSAFGTAKAVFVVDGKHRALNNKWRLEQCEWVQHLSRRLQMV